MTRSGYTGDPSESSLQLVKYILGDVCTVDESDEIELTDEEVAYEIGVVGDKPYLVCSRLVDKLISRLKAISHDYSDSTIKEFLSQKMKYYVDLRKNLRTKAMSEGSMFSTGGRADIAAAISSNSNLTGPSFTTKMHDNTGG